MKIENLIVEPSLLTFTGKPRDNELNVLSQCDTCLIRVRGCHNVINLVTGKVKASIDLNNPNVRKILVEKGYNTPCGISNKVRDLLTPNN